MAKVKGPEAEFRLIGPQEAADMLERNTRNRSIRKSVVERYARDMKLGRWEMTGDAIRFDRGGTLLDGQHRLHACMEAGVAFTTLVIRNATGQGVMDAGPRRTFSDHLRIQGVAYSTATAAAVRMVTTDRLNQHELDPQVRCTITFHDYLDTYNKRPRKFESTAREVTLLWGESERLVPPGMTSGLWMLMKRDNEEVADWFIRRLFDGHNLGPGAPVGLLRRAYLTQTPTRKMTTRQKLALTILAYNYTAQGEEVNNLRWIATGPRSQPFPRIGVPV